MENKLDTHVKAYEGDLQYDFDNEKIQKLIENIRLYY